MVLSQSVLSELLHAFRAGEGVDVIRSAVQVVSQGMVELEASATIGVQPATTGPRRARPSQGSHPRLLATRAGDVELRIPKLRNGRFFPSILEPRRRVDQALYAVVMEAYVAGVSTRSVDDLVAALGADSGISRSEVSRICCGLDEMVGAFRTRGLSQVEFPSSRHAQRLGAVDLLVTPVPSVDVRWITGATSPSSELGVALNADLNSRPRNAWRFAAGGGPGSRTP